jgi:hypothetical protein
MPFHDEFRSVWTDIIDPGIRERYELSLSAHRVDESNLSQSIIIEILEEIAHTKLFLADISVAKSGSWKGQRNGNVMYEVGLAHAVRQAEETILIRSDDERIPFDISGIRVHTYDPCDVEGSKKLVGNLVADACGAIDKTKSLKVAMVVEQLDSICHEILLKSGPNGKFKGRSDSSLNGVKYSSAISRLQSLGVVRVDRSHNNLNLFIFTDFGKAVLDVLGIQRP